MLFSQHDKLAHPGVTSFWQYINSKHLTHTLEDRKQFIARCDTCWQLKLKFYKPSWPGYFIKALKPFDKISIDLVGPKIPSFNSGNVYLLTVLENISGFSFVLPITANTTANLTAYTIIRCLSHSLDVLGNPDFIHGDCGGQLES